MSRIRTNLITNRMANGAPTVSNGLVISGVTTSTAFHGDGSALTGITQTTINNNATTKFITGTNNANELDCEANLSYNNSLVTFASSSLLVNKSTNPTISVTETSGSKSGQFRTNTDGVLVRSLGNYPLIFHTNQTERAQIDGSGRFLIGTNSVYNANSYSNNLIIYENGDAGASIIGNASSSNYASLYLSDTSTASKAFLEAQLGVNGNFTIGTNGSGPIRFNNSGGERMRILGDGRVLINTSDGAAFSSRKLTVADTSSGATTAIEIRSATNGSGRLYFTDSVSSGNAGSYAGKVFYDHNTDYMGFYTGGGTNTPGERMKIDAYGRVTTPNQPSFAAMRSGNQYSLNNEVFPFNTTTHNIGSHFNTSNYRFTAPVAGRYLFTFYSILNSSGQGRYEILINGAADQNGTRVHMTPTTTDWDHVSTSWILNLSANDYIQMYSNSNTGWHGGHWQRFCGELLS